ncbi:MAG: MarR family transcriptional regulator [Dehalococcoidales bacterium]|jgi:DNA-binding MarR family transcriptional regulator
MPKKRNRAVNNPVSSEIEEVAAQVREVNFWLCVKFSDIISRYCEITMKKDDISPLHGMAMYHLVCTGGSSTPTHLAEMMFRSKHSVTKIVDNLEKEGFIVRDFSSKDRRVTHICVTAAGLAYVKNNQNKGDARARQVMDCLSAPQQKTLVGLTETLCIRMTDILEKL